MEAKFRAGKRLHRISNTLVTRKRKHLDSEIEADDEASSTTSTDSSDDWLNGDDEDDGVLFSLSLSLSLSLSERKTHGYIIHTRAHMHKYILPIVNLLCISATFLIYYFLQKPCVKCIKFHYVVDFLPAPINDFDS